MKKIPALMLIALFLLSFAPAHAQEDGRESRPDRKEYREHSGFLPMLWQLIDRARGEEDAARPDRRSAELTDATTTPSQHTDDPASTEVQDQGAESTTSLPSEPASQPQPPAPALPAPSTTTPEHAWGATTTPILNTHNGVNSTIYRSEWPLDRTQSGILFLLSMGLVLAGLLLAERDSLARAFRGERFVPASPLPEKRTALS